MKNWVITRPCELQNGRAYLHDPGQGDIQIFVLPPRDPKLKSVEAVGSVIGCLILDDASQFPSKAKPAGGTRGSLPSQDDSPFARPVVDKYVLAELNSDPHASRYRLVEAAYSPSWSQSTSESAKPRSNDVNPAREAFLTQKANELGFSIEELKSAIAVWTNSVEDPYNKGLAALYDGQYAEASRLITASLSSSTADVIRYIPLARAEYELAHYPAAEAALRKVIAVHPDWSARSFVPMDELV